MLVGWPRFSGASIGIGWIVSILFVCLGNRRVGWGWGCLRGKCKPWRLEWGEALRLEDIGKI